MSSKWKIGQFFKKIFFQVHRSVLMFLRLSTIAFKLITLLPWDLQNQFGVGYWAISYYKYCKLVEICFWREISWYSLLSITASIVVNYFTKILFRENNKKINTNKDVLKKKSSVICYFKLLSRTFLKILVNKFSFGKITG